MLVKVDATRVKETRWHEFAVRFLLGGFITAFAGIIGHKYGASMGGLFLAFPVIFPASATLIDKHEKEKKQSAGLEGKSRARQLVSVDAAGAAMGSVGLFVFALLISQFVGEHTPWLVISAATIAWIAVSVLIWLARKRM